MQSNSANSRADVANVTVVTDDRQIIVPHTITEVVEVNTPGPQGPTGPTGPQGPSVPFVNIGNDIYATTSSLQVTGSFTISGSSTFTNIGPAVFSGSTSLVGATTMSSAVVTGNVQVLGTASINVLQINTTINSTGSNILGDAANDTQTLYGSVIVPTGSLVVSGSVSFGTSSAGLFWDNTNNRLGIGTSSPTYKLEVQGGDVRFANALTIGTSGVAGFTFSSNTITSIQNTFFIVDVPGNKAFNITNLAFSATYFRVAPTTGNILINTGTDAGYKLDVSGSFRATSTASFGGLALFNQNRIDDVSMLNFDTTNNYYQVGKSGNDLLIRTAANNLILFGGKDTTLQTGVIGGHFYFKGGNVNGFGQSNFSIADYNGSNTRFFVSGSGNVGIGTTTPAYALDVNGTIRSQGQLIVVGQIQNPTIGVVDINGVLYSGTGVSIGVNSTNTARLFVKGSGATSATTALRVENSSASASLVVLDNGNVGIGNPTPSASLHISGSSGSALLRVDSPASSSILFVSGSGNVGINTTGSSVYTLDVNGTARVSGILSAQGTYIQYGTNTNVGIGSTNNGSSFANNGPALLYATANINTNLIYGHNYYTGNYNATSGTQGVVSFVGATFNPTSGNAVFNTMNLTATINQTGGANGITRGLYINPTLTAAADFRAIETTAGNVIFGGTGSVTISNILTLTPQSPLPSGVATGSFAVSSSVPPKPYFYDGTTWNALY